MRWNEKYMYGWMVREAQKPFSNFLTTSIQISFLKDFHIFTSSSKRNPFSVFFFFLYCYVADYAAAATDAYIDGNHT